MASNFEYKIRQGLTTKQNDLFMKINDLTKSKLTFPVKTGSTVRQHNTIVAL